MPSSSRPGRARWYPAPRGGPEDGGNPAGVHPNAVRGGIWDDQLILRSPNAAAPFSPNGPAPCPGTYRVSADVSDMGIFGTFPNGKAKPFGSATFTIR
jgi:hypothetical protein